MSVVSIVVLALTNSVAAVFLWNRAVTLMGPGRAGPFMHLIPAYGVVMAIVLLDETLHLYHLIGICLIGVGVYYSTIARRRPDASIRRGSTIVDGDRRGASAAEVVARLEHGAKGANPRSDPINSHCRTFIR